MPWLPFLHAFVLMIINLFFSKCFHNSSAKMPVSNFQIKVRHVIGLKFDTRFPYSISSFYTNLFFTPILSSNHTFREVIHLEASIQLKCYFVVQVAQVFDPVSLRTIRP